MKLSNLLFTMIVVVPLAVSSRAQAQTQTRPKPFIELLSRMADVPKEHRAIADYHNEMTSKAWEETGLHKKVKDKYHTPMMKRGGTIGGNATKIAL